jgi:hypothetical protein
MTASPSLMYEYIIGGHALATFAKETGGRPLFIALLKDPVQRIISLYNHWQVQGKATGAGHSLDLDTLVGLELGLLSTPKAKKFLEGISKGMVAPKGVGAARSAESLRQFMTKMLNGLSGFGDGRLNLRPFGLVLDGLYLAQIHGWWRMNTLIRDGSLLVVKSEYFKDNRFNCVKDHILPFLFPDKSEAERSAVMANAELPKTQVQNIKQDKDPSSYLSADTMKKLSAFYKTYSVEPLLVMLEQRGDLVTIPRLQKNEEWWPQY